MRGTVTVLVCPHSHHTPPRSPKATICIAVSLGVAFDLGSPPRGVGGWPTGVLGTRMPEAPIHEDRDSLTAEDQIGPPSYSSNGRNVDLISDLPQGCT